MSVAIAHGEAVKAPALSAAPHALVEKPLMGDTFDHVSPLRIVVNHVVRRHVITEMVPHGGVGMVDGNIVETLVARNPRSLKQQFEINHVVDDDRKLPAVGRAPTP